MECRICYVCGKKNIHWGISRISRESAYTITEHIFQHFISAHNNYVRSTRLYIVIIHKGSECVEYTNTADGRPYRQMWRTRHCPSSHCAMSRPPAAEALTPQHSRSKAWTAHRPRSSHYGLGTTRSARTQTRDKRLESCQRPRRTARASISTIILRPTAPARMP